MRDISVITNQLTANAILESWFIQNVILQELSFGLDWEIDSVSDSVVIYLEVAEINTEAIVRLKARNNKVVLCQMGDEFLKKYNRDAYLNCDLVLRNYYFPEIFSDPVVAAKTIWIPNGYKSGVGPRNPEKLRKANRRHFLAAFLGWLDNGASYGNERALFRKVAADHPQDILLQPTTSFGQGYNVGMYSAILEYAVFCPCPAGNSPETIRLYDALELGCIPISLRHDFLARGDALGRPPFPLLDDWNQLPAFMAEQRNRISTDSNAINVLQSECIAWWNTHKQASAARFAQRMLDLRMQ